MSLAPKNNVCNWQPSAAIETLKTRARIINTIRDFFTARGVLEVETPLLSHTSVTDPFIQSIQTRDGYYLQTSPEYAMKRLLAAGSGAIFQISKAFRRAEVGRHHNPEFTMIEWYRPGFDHHALMNDMDELLQLILNKPAAERQSYAELFNLHFGIDAHQCTLTELARCAAQHHINIAEEITDRDTWLNLLISHVIEPRIGLERPIFIYDFPASQSALARIRSGNPPVASRFEVYYKGIELANGFHELQDANEQRQRFEKNLAARAALQLETLPIDEFFLSALAHGLPDCAGVALGIDRLIMLATEKDTIADVLSFDISRA